MATKLTKPVSRETSKIVSHRPIIVTLAPSGSQSEALIGLRLKGQRTGYVCALSSIFTLAAMWHGQKVSAAKKEARRNGEPWSKAKKRFDAANRI